MRVRFGALALMVVGIAVSAIGDTSNHSPNPPEPVVTYTESDAAAGQRIEHCEWILDVDSERRKLHAQHHSHGVIETRRVPGRFEPPAMDSVDDFALTKDKLAVINPGPGEYVHVMEVRTVRNGLFGYGARSELQRWKISYHPQSGWFGEVSWKGPSPREGG